MTPVIKDTDFPELVKIYNTKGRREMYDHSRSCYGLKNPYFILRRLIKSDRYAYDEALDKFHPVECDSFAPEQPELFMSLDELCGKHLPAQASENQSLRDKPSEAMENLVHTLISDRLLELSRYVWLDPASKMIRVDRAALEENGYRLEIF